MCVWRYTDKFSLVSRMSESKQGVNFYLVYFKNVQGGPGNEAKMNFLCVKSTTLNFVTRLIRTDIQRLQIYCRNTDAVRVQTRAI